MLGRLRRTTRLDVGLSLALAGAAYLVWALVAGVSRAVVLELMRSSGGAEIPRFTFKVKLFFADWGYVIDLVGLVWMTLSLVLVVLSSRQKLSISWAWMSATLQAMIAACGSVLVSWAGSHPSAPVSGEGATLGEKLSSLSLAVVIPIALLVWATILVWLLIERARLNRHGPTLRDGLRSNIYR